MATLEQVERLREKADVTYDEARAALDSANGDLLDALILLERQGKTRAPAGGGYASTKAGAPGAGGADGAPSAGAAPRTEESRAQYARGESFGDLMRRFGRFCLRVLRIGNTNFMEVTQGGATKASLPITVLVLLLVCAPWITLPLMVIGLFFGMRYRFTGPNIEDQGAVNSTMDSAADAADRIKKSIAEEDRENRG